MNEQAIYPILLIVAGILVSTLVVIVLTRFSNRIVKLFELYPESRLILRISLKLISWFLGLIIFLIFTRLALRILNLDFTMKITEEVIKLAPRYILAALLVLAGFYATRLIGERSKDYKFELKGRILLIVNFIVHMTFIFTALYTIGVDITFFLEFYKVVLWVIGGIVALVISMSIGIPLGINIYEKTRKEIKRKKN